MLLAVGAFAILSAVLVVLGVKDKGAYLRQIESERQRHSLAEEPSRDGTNHPKQLATV